MSRGKFYCDCGMRAVMRRLRQEIIIDLEWSDEHWQIIENNQHQLSDWLVDFHQSYIVDDKSDSRCVVVPKDKKNLISMLKFLLCIKNEEDKPNRVVKEVKDVGCKKKRIQKLNSKAKMRKESVAIDQKAIGAKVVNASPFCNFTKHIFKEIRGNPMCAAYSQELPRLYRERVISSYPLGV